MSELDRLREAANAAFEAGRLEEALAGFVELESKDSDPEWARRVAQVHKRLGDAQAEVEALNRAARGYQRLGDILKAAVTSKLILAIDPDHAETRRRIPELVAGRDAELKAAPRTEPPPPTSPEDQKKIADAINNFYLRDLLPTPIKLPTTTAGVHTIPLEDEVDDDFQLDIIVEEPEDGLPLEVDVSGNIVKMKTGDLPPPPGVDLSAVPSQPPSPASVAEDALRSTLFSELPPKTFAALLTHARLIQLPKDKELFHQGDVGDALYVVASGMLGVIDEGPPRRGVAKLGERRVLGEIALLTNQPRTATILALTDSQLIAIDRAIVARLTAEDPRFLDVLLRFLRDRLVDRLLSSNPLFTVLSERDKKALRPRFRLLEVDAGASLIEQDKMPEGLLIVLAGRAEVVRSGGGKEKILGQLGAGDVAGEISLLTGTPAIGTVRATERSLAVRLPAAAFHTIVKSRPDAMRFIRRLVEQRSEQARAILAGDAPHVEGRVREEP
ncbi:MAG: cyclic nucleotide-binding domain-containing protein [Myxococcota bacterium]